MKLHHIRVENLNSLYGTHAVDLDRDLEGASLFLIQGPTGSGKSTLMDAISLALFGTTPRMEGEGSDRSIAEQIMSRGMGACSAELEFSKLSRELGVRVRYRARWMARRAHGRADGKVQPTERSLEIFRDEDWQTLTSNKREKVYGPEFRTVLEGFGPKDFQRSMLLAQGQIDAMLRATPEERASILERLTSTDQYRTIGARAAAIRRAWQERLRGLEARMEALDGVDQEERAALEERNAELTAARDGHGRELAALEAVQEWRRVETDLAEKLNAAEARRAAKTAEWERLEPQRRQLEEFTLARPALAAKQELDRIGRDLAATRTSLAEAEGKLPACAKEAEQCTEALRLAELRRERASDALRDLRTPVRSVQKATQLHDNARRDLRRATQECEDAAEKLASARAGVAQGRAQLKAELASLGSGPAPDRSIEVSESLRLPAEKQLEGLGATGFTAGADAPSAATFEAVIEWVKGQSSQLEQRVRVLDDHLPRLQRLDSARKEFIQCQARLADFESKRAEHLRQLDELAAQLVQAEEGREAAGAVYAPLRRQMEFIEQRAQLQSDEACPLCGSLDHPWSARESATLHAEADEAREREELAARECRDLEKRRATLEGAVQSVQASIDADRTRHRELTAQIEEMEEAVREAVADTEWANLMDVDAVAEVRRSVRTDIDWLSELKTELVRIREKAATLAAARSSVAGLEEAEVKRIQALSEARKVDDTARDELARHRQTLAEAWAAATAHDEEGLARPASGGDPDELETSQVNWVQTLEGRVRELRTGRDEATRSLTKLQSAIVAWREGRDKLEAQRAQAREGVQTHLDLLELESLEALEARRLTHEDEQALSARVSEVKSQVDRAEQSARDLRERVADHSQSRPDHGSMAVTDEELGGATTAARDEVHKAQEELNAVAARLLAMKTAEERAAQIRGAYDAAIEESGVWERLHHLIGVRDGEQFKEFAQALNLRQLLTQANVHLGRLHDRYRLRQVWREVGGDRGESVRVPTLEFEIEDQWRPGSRRSLKTLSGGESFLISLALALGLSDLRTTSMPIETLLLDEGFGTLDPETLDVALGALQQLQASGRQVGIISHVVGLEERIDARILVQPAGSGRSEVTVRVGRGTA